MWVRVATFEGGDAEKLNKLMDERMSSGEMTPPDGMSSVLVLDNKETRKRKFLAFFDSREALEAAEAGFDQQGDTISEEIRGKRTSVHFYDVAIYELDGADDGGRARVSFTGPDPVTGQALGAVRSPGSSAATCYGAVVGRAEASMDVVVDHADVLHERVHAGWADEAIPLRLQLFRERFRLRGRGG